MSKLTFEEKLNELDKIIGDLESGNLSLDESVKLYKKGVETASECQNQLKAAKLSVQKIDDEFVGDASEDI